MASRRVIAAIVALALGAVAGAAYAPTTGFPFIGYDDGIRLLGNPPVRTGLSLENVRWAFTSEWDANWSPVTWISHMLDFTLYGGDASGHHLTNVLLHALNAMLLFGALRAATGDTFRPAVVVLMLALHPIHVESVAWISERKGLISSTFAFASLWGYAAHARGGRGGARTFAVACLALGLMSKPMLVSLPFLFLLLDHWPLERRQPLLARVLEKWPYLLLVAGSVAITLLAQHAGGAIREVSRLPITARLANAVVASALYLWKLVWPTDLAALYPHPNLPGGTPWSPVEVAGAAAVLALLGWIAWRARHPAPRVGLLWYAIGLLPAIGLVQVGSQAMADRYAYLPAIGIYLGVVYGVADRLEGRDRRLRTAAVAAACVAFAALAAAGQRQIQVWRSSEALFRHATEKTTANYPMHFNLANTLKARGRIEEALAEYRAAIEIWPGMERAHFNLANTLAAENRPDEALEHYRAAVRANPGSVRARNALGRMLVHTGDLEGSIDHYREETRRRPDAPDAHAALAHLMRIAGRYGEAIRAYETVATLVPDDARWQQEIEATRAEQRAQGYPRETAPEGGEAAPGGG